MPRNKQHYYIIPSRKFLLSLQALLCLGLAFFVLWIFLQPTALLDGGDVSPWLLNALRFGILGILIVWGLFLIVKAFRCRILLLEKHMEIRKAFSTTQCSYDDITDFVWGENTVNLLGIFPVLSQELCTIVGENFTPIVTLSSLDYKNLKKELDSLEVRLNDEPCVL